MKKLSTETAVPPYAEIRDQILPVIDPNAPIMRGPGRWIYDALVKHRNAVESNSELSTLPDPGTPLFEDMQKAHAKLNAEGTMAGKGVDALHAAYRSVYQALKRQGNVNDYSGLGWLGQSLMFGGLLGGTVGLARAVPGMAHLWKTRTPKEEAQENPPVKVAGTMDDLKKIWAGGSDIDASGIFHGLYPAGIPTALWHGMIIPATAAAVAGGTYGAMGATDWATDKIRDHILAKRKAKAKDELNQLLNESVAGKTAGLAHALSAAADEYVKCSAGPAPTIDMTTNPMNQGLSDALWTTLGTTVLAELGLSAAAFMAARKARMKGDPNIAKAKALEDAVQRLRLSRPTTIRVSRGPAGIDLPDEDYVPGLSVPATADVTMPFETKHKSLTHRGEFNLSKLGMKLAANGTQTVVPSPGGTPPPKTGPANWLPSEVNPTGGASGEAPSLGQLALGDMWSRFKGTVKGTTGAVRSAGGDMLEGATKRVVRGATSGAVEGAGLQQPIADISKNLTEASKNVNDTTAAVNPNNWGSGIMSFLQNVMGKAKGFGNGAMEQYFGPHSTDNLKTIFNIR